VLELLSRTPRSPAAARLAAVAATQLAAGIALQSAEEKLATTTQRIAALEAAISRDPLTGLIGTALLDDRVLMAQVRAERHDSGMAVFAIDMDGLAAVNELHGRSGGDRVLVEAADRLVQAMRSTDTCARTGPDSFVVVCEDIDARLAAYPVADRLVAALSQPYLLDNGTAVRVTASVGAAMCEGPYEDASALLGRAGAALASAKHAGGARAVVDATLHGDDGEVVDGA
jgi:diguanylate cyclase (GGDEF)-like protein